MATLHENAAPSWNSYRVATFGGQHDTHIETGEDYSSVTLASIFTMEPQAKSKMAGDAFLASTYRSFDARSHEAQREHGAFVALVGDVDSWDLSLETIQAATERFADGAAWLVYSSSHSRDGDQRWRMVFPLDREWPFAQWFDAQCALFTFMESAGIPMDHALSRAGQPIYLPNVPIAYKDGTPLRDAFGDPIYYQTANSGLTAPGLNIERGIVAGGISSLRQQRAADDREREALRKAASERRANRPQREGVNLIEQFNATNSVATMLEICGYTQSPRCPDDWRSPLQTGDTYATRIIEEKWVSLSGSDAASGLGHKHRSGCFGDAYDLYAHYKHNGDHKEAYRALGREQRGNVVQVNFRGDDQDPGWEEVPEWVQDAGELGYEIDAEAEAEVAAEACVDALGFRLTDWSTDRYAGEAPPIRWLCEGAIPQGVPALFAAMGGVGKSFMAIDLALDIASEVIAGNGTRRILGGPVREHGSVVVLGAEDAKDSVHRRMAAIDTGGRRAAALGRLFVVPLPDVGGPMTLIAGQSGEFMQTAKLEALIAQLQAIPDLKLVILDPLQAFVTANITADPAAGQFMWSSLARICASTGATIIACHHMRKEGAATIDTADQAREAIRGSTALIDGARATYALWSASEDATRRVCQESGVEYRPKRVVHGAVVKANDEHDWEVHTYMRSDNGLLSDANDAGKRAAQKVTAMTEMQCLDFLKHIESRWRAGRPFSAAANSQDRYAIGFMQREYGVSKFVAKKQLDDWFHAEMVVSEMADKKTKLVGLKVNKWPN
ncbi:hypothetical protein GCM10008023_05750 [Sphingomonas glacialis]|uniref:AAA family ATPase n=1 Tax=Sphingomonas glacialis TaxID=658225 RepID=A0ABQ3LAB6_9SPHN|nr:AAA family ATPase [Sphingomonas glacialis]GHH09280.1 hypothetical protein GCM10008023_05750 [Sphingomonas glacialis]